MSVTITLNNNSPQALAFVEFAKKLDFLKVTETKKTKTGLAKPEPRVYNAQQEKFRRKFVKALKQADEIRAGKIKAGNLDDLLNEL